jgi:hypothetical protein
MTTPDATNPAAPKAPEPDTSDIPEQAQEFFERARLQRLKPVPATATPSGVEIADFDRLLAIGEKLLRQRQEKVLAAESDYQKARTRVLNDCRTQMERLKIATEEELRRLEKEHDKDMREHERTIMALKGMRG